MCGSALLFFSTKFPFACVRTFVAEQRDGAKRYKQVSICSGQIKLKPESTPERVLRSSWILKARWIAMKSHVLACKDHTSVSKGVSINIGVVDSLLNRVMDGNFRSFPEGVHAAGKIGDTCRMHCQSL